MLFKKSEFCLSDYENKVSCKKYKVFYKNLYVLFSKNRPFILDLFNSYYDSACSFECDSWKSIWENF